MAIVLKEVKIHCGRCGSYLYRLTITTYDLTTKHTEVKEEAAICKKCDFQKFIQAMKGADKIVTVLESEKDVRTLASKDEQLKSRYDERTEKR